MPIFPARCARSSAPRRSARIRDLIEQQAQAHADRVALIGERETYTYRQLNARANRYARWFRSLGFGKGDAIALLMPNRPEYLAIWLGVAKAGGVTALINTNLTGASLAHCISVVAARAVIVDAALVQSLAAARRQLEPGLAVFGFGPCEHPRLDETIGDFDDGDPKDAPRSITGGYGICQPLARIA